MSVSLEKSAAGPTTLSVGRVSYYASSKIHMPWDTPPIFLQVFILRDL